MTEGLKIQVMKAALGVKPFLSFDQCKVMLLLATEGQEPDFYIHRFLDLEKQIETMPSTWGQDGMGDKAIAHLHYFVGGCDWYITEKDVDGGVQQAYGYAVLNGDEEMAEVGYISITEITENGAELDLHFTPCTLAEIKAKRANL